ncbi:hypothetical protein, partial [Bacteroides sp. Ga6A2]
KKQIRGCAYFDTPSISIREFVTPIVAKRQKVMHKSDTFALQPFQWWEFQIPIYFKAKLQIRLNMGANTAYQGNTINCPL